MDNSPPSAEIDLSWQMREREAGLLVELLRTSRITVLYGESGAARTALLTGGVLPTLQRRASDVFDGSMHGTHALVPAPTPTPAPDRRSRPAHGSSAPLAEVVVFFGAWGDEPVADLRAHILAAVPAATRGGLARTGLADTLEALGLRQKVQFLVILDRFEELMALDPNVNESFIDELCEAVNRSDLCANFLLSLSESSRPRLQGLRRRIQGFDDFSVRLLRSNSPVDAPSAVRDAQTSPGKVDMGTATGMDTGTDSAQHGVDVSRSSGKAASRAAAKAETKLRVQLARAAAGPRIPIQTRAVYDFIESTLMQTARAHQVEPWHDAPSRSIDRMAPQMPRLEDMVSVLRGAAELPVRSDEPSQAQAQFPSARSHPPASAEAGKPAALSSDTGTSLHSALKWFERRVRPRQE